MYLYYTVEIRLSSFIQASYNAEPQIYETIINFCYSYLLSLIMQTSKNKIWRKLASLYHPTNGFVLWHAQLNKVLLYIG